MPIVGPDPFFALYTTANPEGFMRIEEIIVVHNDRVESQLLERIQGEDVRPYIDRIINGERRFYSATEYTSQVM